MRKPKAYSLFLDEALVARVDAQLGGLPRSRFVERALEQALGRERPGMPGGLSQDQADMSGAPAEESGDGLSAVPASAIRKAVEREVTDFKAAALVRQARLNKSKGMP